MRRNLEQPAVAPTPLTPSAALGLAKQMRLGKNAYIAMRKSGLKAGADIYPSYDRLLEEKKQTWVDMRYLTLAKNNLTS